MASPYSVAGQLCLKLALSTDSLIAKGVVQRARHALLLTFATFWLAACGGVNGDLPAGEFVPATVEWQLVFSDEFDGSELDTAVWTIEEGDGCPDLCGWGNNELQIYSVDNIEVSGGTLKIIGRQETDGSYTSGRINTEGKYDITYGKVEVRARIPSGAGTWPAIWALHSAVGSAPGADFPDEGAYGPWPLSGEIDIMEAFNYDAVNNNSTKSTTHYGLPIQPFNGTTGSAEKGGTSLTTNADTQFYVYGMEWERGRIRFFVENDSLQDRGGQLSNTGHFQTQTINEYYVYFPANSEGYYNPLGAFRGSLDNEPFDQAFHLLLNFAIGGDPVGDPDPATVFPQSLEVDYVRVYDCANSNPDTKRGCGAVDPTVVPLLDLQGGPLENVNTANPYIESLDLYLDAPEVITVTVGADVATNTLQVDGFTGDGATVVSNIAAQDPEDAENTVWNVAISGGVANVFLASEDLSMDEILDTGFNFSSDNIDGGGNPAPVGEVVFDMYVNSVSDDANIVVKLDSGFPNAGEFVLPLAELAVGEWKTYSVKFDELLANPGFVDCCGGTGVDLERVVNPFVFEVTVGSVDVLLDNIGINNACYVVGTCSARAITRSIPDFIVFDDAVNDQVWDRGIAASDSGSGFVDYTVPNDPNNKVNWEIIDDVDPLRGQVVEVTFNDSTESGVWFIASSTGLTLDSYSAGAVVFDIIVDDYGTNTAGMSMKVDCFFPCTSGDKNLGAIADGVWETVVVPVASLTGSGLDINNVNAVVINPTFGDQGGGITFRLDNIRWTAETDAPPLLQIDLPVTFDDPLVDYSLIDFEGASTSLIDDPDSSGNTVASTTKGAGAQTFAGTVIGTDAGFANPIPFAPGDTTMSVRVRSPAAGIPILLRVENADNSAGAEVIATSTVADQWETLTWDFSTVGIDTSATYIKAIIFFDFGQPGADTTFLWDDVAFGTGGPILQPLDLPVTFDEANVNYAFVDFGGTASSVGADPDNMSNNVAITVKGPPETFAGTVVGDGSGFANPIPFTATDSIMTMRVRAPADATAVTLKVETADQLTFYEVTSTVATADTWETLTFDFSTVGLDPSFVYVQSVVFFELGGVGGGETYYWDDLEFVPSLASVSFPVFDDAVAPVWDVGVAGTESPGFPQITDGNGAIARWVVADGATLTPVDDPFRGTVIEATIGGTAPEFGLLFIQSSGPVDLSAYSAGSVVFDIFVVDYGTNTNGMMMKIDCGFPCTSGDQSIGVVGDGRWETVVVPVSQLTTAGLNLATVNTGIAVYPDIADQQAGAEVVFRIDDVRWEPNVPTNQPVFDDVVAPVWDVGVAGTESPSFPQITDGNGAVTRWVVADGTTLTPADDPARGTIIESTIGGAAPEFGLMFIQSSGPVDLSAYVRGAVVFDIFVTNYDTNTNGMMMKIDCGFPCTSGDQSIGVVGAGQWQTVSIEVAQLLASGLNLATVNTGIAVYPDIPDQQAGADVVFRVDNVHWEP